MSQRIRKIYVRVDEKMTFVFSVQGKVSGRTVHEILYNDEKEGSEKFDIYTKEGDYVHLWKDFYESSVIGKEYFID